ncbi:methyltransferase domain-containing protein [Noviherbaspirillum galbum]|uniref:Methyltransferase domain-containing protein n=1 Tax=Noviherbaspirillum galbum TaxID=2709383 RepID=A0A6B3SSE8_9BURK|nr:methyltransferase domain-containing protein [Noviherbaspirillum galbum]NEX63693.1 methyltransferase domain-containing protein [Noviherbaspirillum galbum]
MAGPTRDFWEERFATSSTPWDRGGPNPQLRQWIDGGEIAPPQQVIVPGCGRGWEVAELVAAGVAVTGLDFAAGAISACREMLDARGLKADLQQADVLAWKPASPVDAVYEQTCLCALHPDHWQAYARQLRDWLKPGGKLLALLAQVPSPDAEHGVIKGPPYHCDINAVRALFPASEWVWPKPPYPRLETGPIAELAVVLVRR